MGVEQFCSLATRLPCTVVASRALLGAEGAFRQDTSSGAAFGRIEAVVEASPSLAFALAHLRTLVVGQEASCP